MQLSKQMIISQGETKGQRKPNWMDTLKKCMHRHFIYLMIPKKIDFNVPIECFPFLKAAFGTKPHVSES